MLLPLVLSATYAPAERLILSPTATKILFNRARFETLVDRNGHAPRYWLGYGLTRDVDLEFTSERSGNLSLNASYNLLTAFTDFAPGLSVGIQDALNKTQGGRRTFLAVTYRLGLDDPQNQGVPFEIHTGITVGHFTRPFVGVQIPFTWQTRLLAEHDGRAVNAGFEFRPVPGAAFRWLQMDGRPHWSLSYSTKF